MSPANTAGFDGERQFSCSYCQRTFRRLEHLQRHTRRHTNERPFACRCGAQFSRRDLLRRHERIARHQESDNFLPRNLGDEQSMQCPDHSTSNSLRAGIDDRDRQEQIGVSRSSYSPITSVNPDQSFRAVPVQLAGQYTSPRLEQAPHGAEGNGERPHPETTRRRPTGQELPIIFPYPQLTLASQIVPHFASPIVTLADRSRLLISLKRIEKIFPNPKLPSTNALSRFIAGYFTGFYPHFPFTHAPTFKLGSCSPELCLAMMAIGAMERFEFKTATDLFYLAKALLFDSQQQPAGMTQLMASSNELIPSRNLLDELRCLICLSQFASWQSHSSLMNEASILQSLLGQSLRLSGLEEPKQSLQNLQWEQWSHQESERRTKLFAFCLLEIHSIAYDVPPSIWCEEINLQLPCPCPEWTAPDATTWSLLRQATGKEPGRFHDTLKTLLSPASQIDDRALTPTLVGNYILMYGLLHKVIWAGRVISANLRPTSFEEYRSTLELALQKWTAFWQNTPESDLEPLGPNGPLPFTSTALLSLAYVRNCCDLFRTRKISTWAPAEIAEMLRTYPPVDRNWSSLLAAYHATNFLSTLVKLGVQYFKCNQSILWSIEATLCGLDCSVFLENWLRGVQDTMQRVPLTDSEVRLVDWIKEVVHEGLSSVDDSYSDEITQTGISPDQIIRVWSHILQGNSPMSFIKMVGEVLVDYRRLRIEGSR